VDATQAGFTAFVRARSAALGRTALLLTGDRQLAEDLLQEALSRTASRWEEVVAGGDPEPYVRRVLYTCAVDGWRRRRVREVVAEWPTRRSTTAAMTSTAGSCCRRRSRC